jgi:hypothetical protein
MRSSNIENKWLFAAWLSIVLLFVWVGPTDFGRDIRYDVVKAARRIDAALPRQVEAAAWAVGHSLGWIVGTHRHAVKGPDASGDQSPTRSPLARKRATKAIATNLEKGLVLPAPHEETDSLARNGESDVDALDDRAVSVSQLDPPEVSNTPDPVHPSHDTSAAEPAADASFEAVVEESPPQILN